MKKNLILNWVLGSLTLICFFFTGLQGSAYEITVKQKPGRLRFSALESDSLYAKVGFRRGDIIREINGQKVDDMTPLSRIDELVHKGGKVTIERDGKLIRMKIKPHSEESPEIQETPANDHH